MKLPMWSECSQKAAQLGEQHLSALEKFILDQEPAGLSGETFREQLNALINTPQTHEFIEAVRLEMVHQRARWGVEHDAGKRTEDWITLAVYLLGKASKAHFDQDDEKLKHHVITTGAALGNWFLALTGESNTMRPGVAPKEQA